MDRDRDQTSSALLYTEKVFVESGYAHMRSTKLRVNLGLIGYGLLAALFAQLCWRDANPFTFGGLCVALAIVLSLLLSRFYVPFRITRHYRNHALARLERRFTLCPDGLAVVTRRSAGKLAWADFHTWFDNEDVTSIYTARRLFFVIPARISSLGFPYKDLKQTLALHVAKRKQAPWPGRESRAPRRNTAPARPRVHRSSMS